MTDVADIDRIVTELRGAAPSWVAMSIDERIDLLGELGRSIL